MRSTRQDYAIPQDERRRERSTTWVWWVCALIVVLGLVPLWLPMVQGPPKEHKQLAEELDSKAPDLVRAWNEYQARTGTAATSWGDFAESGIDVAFMDSWTHARSTTRRSFEFKGSQAASDTLFSVATGVSPTREHWIELVVNSSGLAKTTFYWHGKPVFERSQQVQAEKVQ